MDVSLRDLLIWQFDVLGESTEPKRICAMRKSRATPGEWVSIAPW